MKKLILLCLFFATATLAHSQNDTIANGGFEKWDSLGNYEEPTHWSTLNYLAGFGFPETTTLTTDAHSGNYAAKLETKPATPTALPGILSSGRFLDASFEPDFNLAKYPFKSRPLSFRFYYKAFPATGDTCSMVMYLTRWNPSFNRADTVAQALKWLTQASSYTQANVAFDYILPFTPDSAFFVFSSSSNGFDPTVGSVLLVDDVQLIYQNMGINDVTGNHDRVHVYPNPSQGIVTVDAGNGSSLTASVYNSAGSLVYRAAVDKISHEIDLRDLDKSIYYMVLRDEKMNETRHKIILTR